MNKVDQVNKFICFLFFCYVEYNMLASISCGQIYQQAEAEGFVRALSRTKKLDTTAENLFYFLGDRLLDLFSCQK